MNRGVLVAMFLLPLCASGASAQPKDALKVTAPPDAVFDKYRKDDQAAARKFYKKYLDVKGVAVLASGEVADEALVRTHHIVTHMLAGRSDVLEVMAKNGTRLIVIGKDQVYTDMPEYRNTATSDQAQCLNAHKDPVPNWRGVSVSNPNRRVRKRR